MDKKRVISSLKKLSPEIAELFKEQYSTGYQDDAIKIDKGNGDFFYAVPFDTDETNYLIKVDMKIDEQAREFEDSLLADGNDDVGSEEGNMIQFDENEHDVADE